MAEQLYRKRISPAPSSNIDDIVSKNVLAQLRRDPPPRPATQNHHHEQPKVGAGASGATGGGASGGASGGVGSKSGGVEASDLISSMVKRLGLLEREMKERQGLLQQVQADNAVLKSKLKAAEEEIAKRAMTAIEPRNDSAAVMYLRSENARLRAQLKYAWKQVAEMKAFLNDYGMIWMGDHEGDPDMVPAPDERPSTSSSATSAAPLHSLPGEAASDPMAPRRTSHSGAAPATSSTTVAAAAAVATPASASPGTSGRTTAAGLAAEERARSQEAGTAGLSLAAAAALGRAGEGPGDAPASPAVGTAASATSPVANRAVRATAAAAVAAVSRPGSSTPPSKPASLGAASSPVLPPVPSHSPRSMGLPCSMAELQSKVEELNDLAGDGCGHVVRDGAGQHVLAMQDPVSLVIYRDGLQIHSLPARPFSDPASAAVLRDILDGYFPYVLKRDFPDGVPLRVVDKTSDSIGSAPARRGGMAGGSMAGSRIGGAAGNVRTFDDIDTRGGGGEPLSRDRFLSRLPQAVIKNGKVIEIRSDISKMLGGPGSCSGGEATKADVSLIPTPVDALLSTMQRNHVGPSLPPPSREGQPPATEVTTLQVKSVDGKQTYILKLKYDDTIGSLRGCINAHLGKAGQASAAFEIRSGFPARAYTDDAETLQQAGLVPNATLFLRAL